MSLSNCGAPCLLHCLLLLPKCWEWTFFYSVPWLLTLPFLTFVLEASSSKPLVHSLMLYAAVGVWFVFGVPQGHPGPMALVLFPMLASVMAWWHSHKVLTTISTWASLLAQLTGPMKRNATHPLCHKEGATVWVIIVQKIRLASWGQDHSFCNSFFKAILEHVSNYWTGPYMGGGAGYLLLPLKSL